MMFERIWQDVRYAARSLRRTPGFSAVAILTLALGMGANAAVFSVLKSVLLESLPYANAGELVRVYGRRVDGTQERGPLSAATTAAIAQQQSSFERVGAFSGAADDAVYMAGDGPRMVTIAWVEPALFDVLGVAAAHGRTLRDSDTTTGMVALSAGQEGPDTASTAMVTHEAWQRLFGGDLAVVGRGIRLNGLARTVVGVLPPGFVGPMGAADFYLAFDLSPVVAHAFLGRGAQWLGLTGRLKPDVTWETARREVDAIGVALARQFPQDNATLRVTAMPLRDALVGDARRPLVIVMASALLVLLVACANLAGAQLSRALTRRKEFAIRTAIGAGRRQLVRQLLTETLLLAVAGGALGLVLAVVVLAQLRVVALQALPAYAEFSLDGGTVLLATLLALCTGAAFGITPAVAATRADSHASLREESRNVSESGRSRRLRGALVAAQMALCLSLLVGAGLLARSLWAMTSAPIGLDADGVLAGTVQLPLRDYPAPDARARFAERLLERLRLLPGVDTAATASAIPTAVGQSLGLRIDGAPLTEGELPLVLFAVVSSDYLRTLRIPLRAGRFFDGRDHRAAPPTVVISETMAHRYWPARNALGARIRLGPNASGPLLEVVGIVGDVRNDRTRPDAEPMVYRSTGQIAPLSINFFLRTHGDPTALSRAVQRELGALAPGLPLRRVATLEAIVGEDLVTRRLPAALIGAFGVLALLLASVGVYAMFASLTAARQREFGIRMALGSRRRAIAALVVRQGAGWITVGLVGGAVGMAIVVRVLSGLLYEISPWDPTTLGLCVIVLIGCATVALWIPVRRATHVNPVTALQAQ